MHLLAEDIENIGHILARRYFFSQGWRFTDLKQTGRRIIEAFDTVNEQYSKYPNMSRDWYVENSAQKDILLMTKWEPLNVLTHLLRTWPDMFDFYLKINAQSSLCIIKSLQSDENEEQDRAISDARNSGFNVYIFTAHIPDSMDFELDEVIGGISGRGVFK